MSQIIKDLTGKHFGKLLVLEIVQERRLKPNSGIVIQWLCACECGKTKKVDGGNLTSGRSLSCGCVGAKKTKERSLTHGLSNHHLYSVWSSMIYRCCNQNCNNYQDYGGRGITICAEWRENPEVFIKWALANGYKREYEIDRKNNNEGYKPENCHFIPKAENLKNTRRNRVVTIFGERLILQDAHALYSVVSREQAGWRLRKGWAHEPALLLPRLSTHYPTEQFKAGVWNAG